MASKQESWGETGTFKANPGKARLVVLSGEQSGRIFPVSLSCIIGRDEHATVNVELLEVSRRHARITFEDHGSWSLEDLNSSNGTWLDGVPVKGKVPLRFGSRLQVGGSLLMVFTHRDVLEDQVFQMQKLEVLGRLAGEVAHDLRNLLTVYSYNIEFIQEAVKNGELVPSPGLDLGELTESFKELDDVTGRATQLTGRLLGFSRQEGEERERVDLGPLVHEVAAMARSTLPDTIRVQTHVESRPLPVSATAGRIHQAIMNLCINARDAMPHGGELHITASHLRSRLGGLIETPVTGDGDFVVISVTDSGIGMDEETQGKIFEPFFTTKGRGEGTGLGLATVYAVAKDHGGQISVRSAPGSGTTFTLAFPMATSSGAQFRATRHADRPTTAVGATNIALVVSPRSVERQNMARHLGDLGLTVFWEEDPGDALARMKNEEEKISVVLLDLEPEGGDAVRTGQAIRRMVPSVPLIIWTQRSTPGAKLEELAARIGAHAVLLSPVDVTGLRRAISYGIAQLVSRG